MSQNKRRVCSNESISILTLQYIPFTRASLLQLEIQGNEWAMARFPSKRGAQG